MGKTYKIAVMPGDGTGPEVVAEGLKVLQAAAAKYQFALDLTHYDFGGERYLRTGEILPASAVDELKGFDSIYLGAVGASGRRARHPGEGSPPPSALRAGPVHQPASRPPLPGLSRLR